MITKKRLSEKQKWCNYHSQFIDTPKQAREHQMASCEVIAVSEKESTPQHTPTPWDQRPQNNGQAQIYGVDGKTIAITYYNDMDAAFIVRAVNSHETMLRALKDVSKAYQDMFEAMPVAFQTFANIVDEAISQAEAKS